MSLKLSSLLLAILLLAVGGDARPVAAQEPVFIPGYWDLRRRPDKPDVSRIRQIRFLTESDYPPFHFLGPDGRPAGFEVDLARALCEILGLPCTIQNRRWDGLQEALEAGEGDAIVAAFRITPKARERFLFTQPYHKTPARFVTPRGEGFNPVDVDALKGKRVAVVAGSAHEAYLKTFFPEAVPVPETDLASVLSTMRYGGAAAAFVDGVGAAFWLNGAASENCCAFAGGPYSESRYFGEGVGIALRRDGLQLQVALDWGLQRLAADGVYGTLYLKYFPVGFY
jgi:polar amino acid transport system substrate-binding protein